MALTPSTMLALGTAAPDFSLPDVVTGKAVALKDFASKKGLLVMFICQHCPYVQHIKEELTRLGRDYAAKDVALVGISSNDAAHYPDDAPEELKKFAQRETFRFPFLYDETQRVAQAHTAACTPDFFLFDKSRKLVYRGQLDDSRPGSGKPVTGKDLRAALDALLADKPQAADQKPSIGCNIKWKSGAKPAYFLLLLSLAVAMPSWADVTVTRTVQTGPVMGFGGGSKQTTTWIANDKRREEPLASGKPTMAEKMTGSHLPQVTRLDKKVVWTLNPPKKTYSETSLVQAMKDDSKADGESASGDEKTGPEEKPTVKITKAEFKVKPLNQKKTVNGFACEGYEVTTLLEMQDLESKETKEMKLMSTLWTTPETGSLVQLRQEEEAYAKAYAHMLGLTDTTKVALKDFGTAMIAGLAGTGDAELSKALAGMPAELKKVKGYPIETKVEWFVKENGQDVKAPAMEAEEPTVDMSGGIESAFGGFAAGLAKKHASKKAQEKMTPSSSGALMSMTTTIQSVSAVPIAASVFEIPAGYKKTN